MPKFDKGLDDRVEPQRMADGRRLPTWSSSRAGVLARGRNPPPTSLRRSTNSSATKTPTGAGARYVNDALGAYQALFARFDRLVFLQVPDFDAVRRWRAEQELQLPNRDAG